MHFPLLINYTSGSCGLSSGRHRAHRDTGAPFSAPGGTAVSLGGVRACWPVSTWRMLEPSRGNQVSSGKMGRAFEIYKMAVWGVFSLPWLLSSPLSHAEPLHSHWFVDLPPQACLIPVCPLFAGWHSTRACLAEQSGGREVSSLVTVVQTKAGLPPLPLSRHVHAHRHTDTQTQAHTHVHRQTQAHMYPDTHRHTDDTDTHAHL